MKENTKQILKVSICTLMALVLFAGVILMCIYFAFDNTNDGVADAYTDEEFGVSNLEFTVDEGFYIKNIDNEDTDYIERLINYFFYFIPGVMDPDVSFSYTLSFATITCHFINSNGWYQTETDRLHLELTQDSASDFININLFMSEVDDLYFFEFTYDYVDKYIDQFLVSVYNTVSADAPHNYYVNAVGDPDIESTFVSQYVYAVFDDPDIVDSVSSFSFSFPNVVNLGVFLSPNETFAFPPVVMPQGVYNTNLQNKYNEGAQYYLPLVNELQQSNNDLSNQLQDTLAENDDLRQQYSDLENQYDNLFDENSELQQTIQDLQNQINQNNALIEELREDIRYYESLDLNMSLIDVFNLARMKSSTFVYDGVTYTSNSIVSTDDGWSVYSSTYYNQELPPNYGVGFSLFLPESISNTKFYVYGDITGWYNYTSCTEPDEQGNQTCYNFTEMIPDISVGYRNQNGNIVKVGTFTSNLPGVGGVDFFVDTPTNEIVFFVENCNLMRFGRSVQVSYYQYDTQSIYNDGYETGKSQGIKIGREEGYYQGVADANDYSFFSLFTSVFDAPITAIVGKWGDSDGDGVYQREGGMLNFYIPGLDINFAPFLLSLFTIAIIILVIRFVMARKS